jgi:hypothetical protein
MNYYNQSKKINDYFNPNALNSMKIVACITMINKKQTGGQTSPVTAIYKLESV